jgi:hypothetical protein
VWLLSTTSRRCSSFAPQRDGKRCRPFSNQLVSETPNVPGLLTMAVAAVAVTVALRLLTVRLGATPIPPPMNVLLSALLVSG